jgi:outer membrane protein TolC
LGKSGYADTFRTSFEDSRGSSYDASVGIEFSYALGNRRARGEANIASSTFAQSEEAISNLRDLVRFDVLLSENELRRAFQQIDASRETERFRKQALEAVESRFEIGTATSLDVALVQRDYLNSQTGLISALVDYQKAKIQFYLAEGSLLERRGLSARSTLPE